MRNQVNADRTEFEQLRGARGALKRVRRALLQPTRENLETAAEALGTAVQLATAAETAWRHGLVRSSAMVSEIQTLRRELRCVAALVHGAGAFFSGWARLIATGDEDSVNYSSNGQPRASTDVDSPRVVMHG